MQEQKVPVLIFAQSGRHLAQSATQAGHTVWVADCFGDIDTQNIAARWQKLPAFAELEDANLLKLLTSFANGQKCILVCGSGIEKYFKVLSQLPTNIKCIGNNSDTIKRIKTPKQFFSLLSQHDLPFPYTQFSPPDITKNWLFKQNVGLGGTHITRLDEHGPKQGGYFQQTIQGTSGSVLFLANGKKTHTISINKQFVSNHPTSPFQLAAVETSFELSQDHHQLLTTAIDIMTQETGLRGLNSLDFIIDEHAQLFILEVNPRPSASSELINDELLFQRHIQACQGKLPKSRTINPDHYSGLYYLYAPQSLTIPRDMLWPIQSHDLPHSGTVIEANQPICTITIIDNDEESCRQQQQAVSLEIMQQLTS